MVFDFTKETINRASSLDVQALLDEAEESNCINWELLNLRVDRDIKKEVEEMLNKKKEEKSDVE